MNYNKLLKQFTLRMLLEYIVLYQFSILTGDNSPIAGFLKKNSAGGMHHICIEVDDIEATVR